MRKIDLKNYDPNMTVGDLIKEVDKREKDKEKEIIEKDNQICSLYRGSYLKRLTDCHLFGKTLGVIHIGEISFGAMSTSWERLYSIKSGTKITFNRMGIGKIEQSGNTLYSEKELNEFKIIDESEFRLWRGRWNYIKEKLKSILSEEL